jgi:PhnB protein
MESKNQSETSVQASGPAIAATGLYTTNGIPHGSTTLSPHLVVSPAVDALEFYSKVFEARIIDVTRFPGGNQIAHAVLDFGSGLLTLSDPLESYQLVPQASEGGHSFSLAVYVPDTDRAVAAAVDAHAVVREPPMTFVSGDRFASIIDPFGVRWSVMTRVEDLSPEESAERVQAWAAEQTAG